MRMLITGVADGEARVIKEIEIAAPGDALSAIELLAMPLDDLASRPAGRAPLMDIGVPPGFLRWNIVHFAPNAFIPAHVTDTVDYHTVVAGSIELILDDGPHRLTAGDCAAVNGVDHAWRTGPEGCTSSIIILGTPPA